MPDLTFRCSDARLFGSFDFYTRTTTDLLFNFAVPNPPNLYSTAWVNIGEIKSSGLELSLSFKAVQKADFSYTFSFSPSYNLDNTLVSLSGEYNGCQAGIWCKGSGRYGISGTESDSFDPG